MLIRLENPYPINASLAPSQDTTPDQLMAFYRSSTIPFTRHSPLPASGSPTITAVAISQTLASRAVRG